MALDLERIEKLEAEWRSLQPLPAELDKKLWEKLRLEWNYNSNHIEGNTLTYKETEMYLLRGQTSGVHVEREYVEMKGHDYAIEIVRNLASSSEELTEADIRNLNQVILKQSFYKDAITPDGRQARKQIVPGRYKLEPNSVRLANGELFRYADPLEVPMRMAKLMQALRTSENKDGLELLATLAITHHEFALIHPFDDGNGRVARLLTNYVLLKKGFPPLVVPSAKKADYLKGLEQADAGDLTALTEFFGEQLIWSLELGIRSAKGERLEEPRDVDKELDLFLRKQKGSLKEVAPKSVEVLEEWLNGPFRILLNAIDTRTAPLTQLFATRTLFVGTNISPKRTSWEKPIELSGLTNDENLPGFVEIVGIFDGYRGEADSPFGIQEEVTIQLDRFEYIVRVEGHLIGRAIYSENLPQEKEDEIVDRLLRSLMGKINWKSKKD